MRLGTLRFLILFALAAVAGALFYYLFHSTDFVPMVGASAAISGVMAAAIRFVFQPGAPLGPALYGGPLPSPIAARLRAVTLRESLRDKRVIQFTLTWFAINFVFGIAAAPLGITASAIAWEAHAGGFIAGFLLFGLIDPPSIDPSEITQWQYPMPPNELAFGPDLFHSRFRLAKQTTQAHALTDPGAPVAAPRIDGGCTCPFPA